MKISFLGAARTVTGSCYVLEACGHRFAVDCGMHQGNSAIEERNRDTDRYAPTALDAIFLTHAHIDHSGLMPRLVANGFSGPIYCTEATRALASIMLLDSAHIQEMEAQSKQKKYQRRGLKNPPKPLYTQDDATKTAQFFHTAAYHERFEPFPGIVATFYDAGHILGSAQLFLEITEEGKRTTLLFSGDIGRPSSLIVRDPEQAPPADYVFLESTYGDRDHKNESLSVEELSEAIAYSYAQREKVLIPAFAVERTQEILCTLHILAKKGSLPSDMPIFVDSPLAIRASAIFSEHRELLDAETRAILTDGPDIFALPNLFYTLSAEESQAINTRSGPALVIAGSGMCTAGRIRHHLRHSLWKKGASIVFVGYQAVGTVGRKLIEKAQKITLFGEDVAVAARIFTINGFSGHAGQSQLLDWLEPYARAGSRIVLVHGEPKAQDALKARIHERFQVTASIPDYLEEVSLEGSAVTSVVQHETAAYPRVNWTFLAEEVERKWAMFRAQLADIENRPWVDQKEVEEKLATMEFYLTRLIARL
ncbi:MAG: MBL fold metallo-hydrolase [Desulfovibrionaceae bacterium]|nr:MBL fold metallo-hydrolase [Desulfovibrionaceae bacterium]